MRAVTVDLNIPADEYLAMYQGLITDVVARAHDGRVIRFPAKLLQKFVTHGGVYGQFTIYFDNNNKFQSIVKN